MVPDVELQGPGGNDKFFKGASLHADFICNIGHGANENLVPRLLRLPYDEARQIL